MLTAYDSYIYNSRSIKMIGEDVCWIIIDKKYEDVIQYTAKLDKDKFGIEIKLKKEYHKLDVRYARKNIWCYGPTQLNYLR